MRTRSTTLALLFTIPIFQACSSTPDIGQGAPGDPEPNVAQQVQALCLTGPAFPSCFGECGHLTCSPIDPGACCACDSNCVDRDDCCCDFEVYCAGPPPPPPPPSCEGHCGGESPDGCWCDSACTSMGDCCEDFSSVCDGCEGFCGGPAPAGCFCDAACTGFGDCCGDFTNECLGWAKVFPQGSSGRAQAVAADPPGNAYLAAQVAGTWNPGGGSITTTSNDSLIVSWDLVGTYRWATRLTADSGTVNVRAMTVRGANLYIVGQFTNGSLRKDGTVILTRPSGATNPAFAVALNTANGAFRWARSPSGYTSGIFHDVTTDTAGNLVIAAQMTTSSTFGRIASYDALGALRWVRPTTLTSPFLRVAEDEAATSYVLEGPPDRAKVSAYSAAGVRLWTTTPIENGILSDVTFNPATNQVTVVGSCLSGCRVAGFNMAQGHLTVWYRAGDGSNNGASVNNFEGGMAFRRIDLGLDDNVTALGDFRNGTSSFPFPPASTGAYTTTNRPNNESVSQRLVASAASTARFESRDLAMSSGVPRYACVESDAPIVVDGSTHDTTAPYNGMIIQLP